MMQNKPNINNAHLWEYNLETFNWVRSYKIVIERVLEWSNLEAWQEMVKFYSRSQILEIIDWSAQLDQRDKEFSGFFFRFRLFTCCIKTPG